MVNLLPTKSPSTITTSILANLFKPTLPSITLKPASLPLASGPKTPAPTPAAPSAFSVVAATTQAAISSIQTLGQQLLVQTYNADGNLVTKAVASAQIAQNNFTPETLTAAQQASEARLVASLKLSPVDVSKIWQDSVKIDYLLCIKSQESLPVDFNVLQTPELSTQFTYNFYDSDEKNLTTQEDQSNDPLLKNLSVPRFVQLNWDCTNGVTPSGDFATRTQSEAQMAATYFNSVRGNATLANAPVANSFQKNLAQVQPIFKNGQALSLVDTHDLERGFNSTSNSRLFKNTATTTVNTRVLGANAVNFTDIVLEEI